MEKMRYRRTGEKKTRQTQIENIEDIFVFARPRWLRERSTMLRYKYIACLAA
jgi:hypothetical protein